MTTKKKPWDILSKIDCADKVENKNGLTYLSWAWAWGILKAHFPDASFEKHYFDGLPYAADPNGYAYVKVSVTVEGWRRSAGRGTERAGEETKGAESKASG